MRNSQILNRPDVVRVARADRAAARETATTRRARERSRFRERGAIGAIAREGARQCGARQRRAIGGRNERTRFSPSLGVSKRARERGGGRGRTERARARGRTDLDERGGVKLCA